MKAFAAIPLALLNGPFLWGISQATEIQVSLGDAMAVGTVASVIPSAFMIWAGLVARKVGKAQEAHAAEMRPWREDVLQRIKGVETTCSTCNIGQFREEIIQVLHGKTEQYQAALSEIELRVITLETEAEDA